MARHTGPRRTAREIADRLIGDLLTTMGIPGGSAALSIDGRWMWSLSAGVADRESRAAVTERTIFRLGSISKTLTGTLAVRLAQDAEIDLDRPVIDHLDHLPDAYATLTLREILTFTSGIPAYASPSEQFNQTHYRRARDVLPLFIHRPLGHAPGRGYLYSSYAYVFAAVVMEAVTGLEFPELMRRRLLEPLGMGDTILEDVTLPDPRLAAFYDLEEDRSIASAMPVDFHGRAAASGYASTVPDALRFAAALAAPGYLTRPWLDELVRRPPAVEGVASPWGIGWRQRVDWSRRRVMLGGGQTVGCNGCVLVYPEQRAALAFLSNLGGYPMQHIGLQPIVECFLAEMEGGLALLPQGFLGDWRLLDPSTGADVGELRLEARREHVGGSCQLAGQPPLLITDGFALGDEARLVAMRPDVGAKPLRIVCEGGRNKLVLLGRGVSAEMVRAGA